MRGRVGAGGRGAVRHSHGGHGERGRQRDPGASGGAEFEQFGGNQRSHDRLLARVGAGWAGGASPEVASRKKSSSEAAPARAGRAAIGPAATRPPWATRAPSATAPARPASTGRDQKN